MADREAIVDNLLDKLEDLELELPPSLPAEALLPTLEKGAGSREYRLACKLIVDEMGRFDAALKGRTLDAEGGGAAFEGALDVLLAELGFPHGALSGFELFFARMDFLATELQIRRMVYRHKRAQAAAAAENGGAGGGEDGAAMDTGADDAGESKRFVHAHLAALASALATKSSREQPAQLVAEATETVSKAVAQLPEGFLAQHIVEKGDLTPEHLAILDEINSSLQEDYRGRREMLVKRLDVTMQSFMYGPKALENKDAIDTLLKEARPSIQRDFGITVDDIFVADNSLANMKKTSSKDAVTESSLRKIVIGSVPDRGGRPRGSAGPSGPAGPAFAPRQEGGGGRGGGYGGRGRGRGGGRGGGGRGGGGRRGKKGK